MSIYSISTFTTGKTFLLILCLAILSTSNYVSATLQSDISEFDNTVDNGSEDNSVSDSISSSDDTGSSDDNQNDQASSDDTGSSDDNQNDQVSSDDTPSENKDGLSSEQDNISKNIINNQDNIRPTENSDEDKSRDALTESEGPSNDEKKDSQLTDNLKLPDQANNQNTEVDSKQLKSDGNSINQLADANIDSTEDSDNEPVTSGQVISTKKNPDENLNIQSKGNEIPENSNIFNQENPALSTASDNFWIMSSTYSV
jgi:hypothetical protein